MTRRRMQAVHMGNIRRLGACYVCIDLLHNSVINRGGGLVTRPRPLGLHRTASVTTSSSKDCLSLVRIITACCTVMGCRESRSAPKDDATANQGGWKDLYRVSRFDASTDVRSSEYLTCSPPPISSTPTPVPSSSSAPSPPSVSNTPTNESINTIQTGVVN